MTIIQDIEDIELKMLETLMNWPGLERRWLDELMLAKKNENL